MITQARLKKLLDYDPATGVFVWRVSRGTVRAGSMAGGRYPTGYRHVKVDRVSYYSHRLAWLYMTGEMPRAEIDHINCVRDDNRFDNLREASPSENQHNSRTPVTNTSGHKCIYWAAARGKWQAAIKTNNVSVFIGRFDRIEDAVAAVAEARARLHKDFGRAA